MCSVDFWTVVASRVSWSRFVLLSGVGASVVGACFIDRVVRPWVGWGFPIGVVVNNLQEGHGLAWRWFRWCMCKLPMLAPSASMRAAARVASILSIERAMSVDLPASSRAFVDRESALNTVGFGLVFVSSFSSSSCTASGLSASVGGGLHG